MCTSLTEKQLSSFISIYEKMFGIILTEQEALDKAVKLITLMKDIILLPNIEEIGMK